MTRPDPIRYVGTNGSYSFAATEKMSTVDGSITFRNRLKTEMMSQAGARLGLRGGEVSR